MDQEPITPEHDVLINFIAKKYYKGGHHEKIRQKLFSDEAAFNKALGLVKEAHYPKLDSADFSSKYYKKYGNPFAQQEAPEAPVSEAQPVETPAEAPAQEAATENPYAQIMPGQQSQSPPPLPGEVVLDNGQLLSQQPNVLPIAEVESEDNPYHQFLPDPALTANLPDVSGPDRSGFLGATKDVMARGFNAAVPGMLNTVGNVTEYAGDAFQMFGNKLATDDKKTDEWADAMRSQAKDWKVYVSDEGAKSVVDDPLSPRAWMGAISEAGVNMAQILGAGALAGGPGALIVGGGLGLSSIYDAAETAGISDTEKVVLGTALAPAIAVLERVGLGKALKSPAFLKHLSSEIIKMTGGQITKKAAAEAVSTIIPAYIKANGKEIVKGFAGEAFTEGLQTTLEDGSQIAYDATVGEGKKKGAGNYGTLDKGIGDALLNMGKNVAANAAVGGIVGAATGGVGGVTANRQKAAVIEQELQKPDLDPAIREILTEKLSELKPTITADVTATAETPVTEPAGQGGELGDNLPGTDSRPETAGGAEPEATRTQQEVSDAKPDSEQVREEIEPDPEDGYIKGKISSLFNLALKVKDRVVKEVIRPITALEAQSLKEKTGLEIDEEYTHTIDNAAINHILNKHGADTGQDKQGQVPVSEKDFLLIPEIISFPDDVKYAGKNKKGLDVISYTKTFEDGTTYYLEEVRTGRKELNANSMYKRKGSSGGLMNQSSPSPTPSAPPDISVPDVNIRKSSENSLTAKDSGASEPVNELFGIPEPAVSTNPTPEPAEETVSVGKASYSVAKTGDGYTVTNASSGRELTNPSAANFKAAVKNFEAAVARKGMTPERTVKAGNKSYAVDRDPQGIVRVKNPDGTEVGKTSKNYAKAVAAYKEAAIPDFVLGKEAAAENATNEAEYHSAIVGTSENPAELAAHWLSLPDGELDHRMSVIRDNLRPTTQQSYRRNGDINEQEGKGQIRLNYIRKDGTPLDTQAQALSEIAGVEIAEADLIDFINANPGGQQTVRPVSDMKEEAAQRFHELTGLDLDTEFASKLKDAYFSSIITPDVPLSEQPDSVVDKLIAADPQMKTFLETEGLILDGDLNVDKLNDLIESGDFDFAAELQGLTPEGSQKLKDILHERRATAENKAVTAGQAPGIPQPSEADRGGQPAGEGRAVPAAEAVAPKGRVVFEHAGTRLKGTVTKDNGDGTLSIKGSNGRNYPSIPVIATGSLPAQTSREFAPIGATMAAPASGGQIMPDAIFGKKPKPLREIMLDLSKGMPGKLSYTKNPGRRKALGTYNPRTAAVKIRYKNDLGTTAHELGHSLDDRHGLLSNIPQEEQADIHDELMGLAPGGSKAPKGHPDPMEYELGEGVAEYIRAYLVNPMEAWRRAPRFTTWFENTIPEGTMKMVDDFGTDIRTFVGASAHDAIMSNVDMELHTDKPGIFTTPEAGRFGLTWYDRLSTSWVDSLAPLKKSILFAKTERGIDSLRPSKDPYILAENLAGHNDKLDNILQKGLVNGKLERVKDTVTGKPMTMSWLIEGLDSTDKVTLQREQQEVVSYMVAERSLELIDKRIERDIDAALNEGRYVSDAVINSNSRFQALAQRNADNKAVKGSKLKKIDLSDADIVTGVGGGIVKDSDQARRRLAEMEGIRLNNPAKYDRIREAARRYQAYADGVMQYAVDKGRMSQEQYDAIKLYNTQYVALNRILEAGPEEEIVVHRGGGSSLASSKGVADKKIKGSGATIKNPYVSLLDFTNKTIEESDRNDFKLAFRELFQGDRDMYSGEQEALSQVARLAAQGDKNTVKIFVDGQAEHWQLQEDVYKALTAFDSVSGNSPLISALSSFASVVRWTVTNSPVFALRNKVRDMQNWLIISKSGPQRAFSRNKATRQEMRSRYEMFGGGQAGYYLKDDTFYYTQMEMAMEEMAKDKQTILADPMRVMKGGWEKYKAALSESETSTRIMEFTAAFKKAKEKGLDDYDASVYAAHEARDLMNFARAGNTAREINKIIPFFNAAVQGLSKTIRTAKENPKGVLIRWVAFAMLPAMANRFIIAALGGEEEKEYQKMPAYQRDLFYNFPVPMADNMWISIPKPFEFGVLGSGAERLLDMLYYKNNKAFDGYAGSVARTLMPIDESAIAGPLRSAVEVSANYDFFRQKAIVSPYEQDKAVEMRPGTERASELGQLMQKAFGNTVDARYIDHLIGSNFTYFGNWTMKLSDEIAGTENQSKGFNLSDTGFIKQDPVYNSIDVQWVMEKAKELGLAQSRDMKELSRLLGDQFNAETSKEKEKRGKVARDYAERLRAFWEAQKAEETVKAGKKVKKMPLVKN